MKKIFNIFIPITIILVGCDVKEIEPTYHSDSKEMLCNQISHRVALQLKREKDLTPFGFGGGTVPNIRMLSLSFKYYKEVDIEQARDVLIAVGSLFLKTINENKQVRPYLENYPFESKNIEIYIFLYPKNARPDALKVISIFNGNLDYEIKHPEKEYGFKKVYTETYEEALVKHNKESSDIKL